MARQINVFVFTLFLISTTLTAPFLYNEVSPVLPVLPAILSFLVMVSLLKTSFSDPGILPRAPNMEVAERARQHFNEIISDPDYNPDTSALPDPPRTKQIKGTFSNKRRAQQVINPYSLNSVAHNCCWRLCGPEPPSHKVQKIINK
ncbi:hypothetical protein COOONC_10026 [Cooperia oncophora]